MIILIDLTIYLHIFFIVEESRAKAQSIVKRHQVINTKPQKTVNVHVNLDQLPKLIKDEEDIGKYMQVLRKTNEQIGLSLLNDRLKDKAEQKEIEKLKNINVVKNRLIEKRNEGKQSLKKKIRQMRRDKVFPLPKSFMNYKKSNGLLCKNSIKLK